MIDLLLASDPVSHVIENPDSVKKLWDGGAFGFTYFSNHIFMQFVATALLIWLIPKAVLARRGADDIRRHVPTRFGGAIEAICLGLRDQVFRPNLGDHTNKFTPLLWSLFFYILACNILGLFPLADWIGHPLGLHFIGGTATGNIFVTATLALFTLVLVVYNGLAHNGMGYVKHFFMGPPLLAWFIALLEIMGLGFKAMALCVRLFANMMGGHMILAVLLSFVKPSFESLGTAGGGAITIAVILGSVAFNFLELFVAFLHAFIFTTLTAVFLGQAVNIHHEEHAHDDHGDRDPAHAGGHH